MSSLGDRVGLRSAGTARRTLAVVLAAAAIVFACAGPPLVQGSAADAATSTVSGFRYLPESAFDAIAQPVVTTAGEQRWSGAFLPEEPVEVLRDRLPTGRYYIAYSLTGRLDSPAPARLDCGLVEAGSGIRLLPQPSITLASGGGRTDQKVGATFDLPEMTIALACASDTLVYGTLELRRAELRVLAIR